MLKRALPTNRVAVLSAGLHASRETAGKAALAPGDPVPRVKCTLQFVLVAVQIRKCLLSPVGIVRYTASTVLIKTEAIRVPLIKIMGVETVTLALQFFFG